MTCPLAAEEFAKRWTHALESGDPRQLFDLLHPQVHVHCPAISLLFRGRETVASLLKATRKPFCEWRRVQHILESGTVVVQFRAPCADSEEFIMGTVLLQFDCQGFVRSLEVLMTTEASYYQLGHLVRGALSQNVIDQARRAAANAWEAQSGASPQPLSIDSARTDTQVFQIFDRKRLLERGRCLDPDEQCALRGAQCERLRTDEESPSQTLR